MQLDMTDVTAQVYAFNSQKNIMYIKVHIPSLRMYINSCTVRPSPKYNNLWFQMPSFLAGKWVNPIEFSGDSFFLDLIRDEAMRAADSYIRDNKLNDQFPSTDGSF